MTIPHYIIFHILDYLKFKDKLLYILLDKSIYNHILNIDVIDKILTKNGIKYISSRVNKNERHLTEQDLIIKRKRTIIFEKAYRLCDECHLTFGSERELFNIRVCITCDNLRQYKLITKTNAIKKYKVKQMQLDTLDCMKRRNPYSKHKPEMTLYREIDVIALQHRL